jgi:predicted dehydrogenase
MRMVGSRNPRRSRSGDIVVAALATTAARWRDAPLGDCKPDVRIFNMPEEKALPVRLAILGTGSMARQHAERFAAIEGVSVVSGIDVDHARAAAFCQQHGIGRAFGDLAEALAWGEFDAVANVTPDNAHHRTTLEIAAAGHHVFCEKPLATNFLQAEEMTKAVADARLVGMVNLTYRNVPALQKARELVRSGAIGEVRHVEASYLQSWLASKYWGDWRTESRWLWRLSKSHGSNGVLGDIGIHILDFASYGAASAVESVTCRLKAFPKAPDNQIDEYVLDANDSFVMAVEFANGALGTIHASRWATGNRDDLRLRIFGSKGGLDVSYGGRDAHGLRIPRLDVCLGEDVETQTWRVYPLTPVETNYERFIRAVRTGETLEPSFAHAANLQRILDKAMEAEIAPPGQTVVVNA